jgi:Domain of unknown function (DUF4188)
MGVERRTVDLTAYPNLVVIYLGMKVNALTGLKTVFGFGPKIANSVAAMPDGLLRHESMVYSLLPPHVGMRQYWRDFASLERWHARSRICNGGRISCGIPGARASGMKPISYAAASKRSTTISRFRWGCRHLPPQASREGRCFQLERGWGLREARLYPCLLAKPAFMARRMRD